ncbi:hypothetical protein RN001_005309 [Aquatica leii]|uniref:Uncharacterized protein n=1 Tax=Aquatica leii TaxID=1421715 RepID=A0AAN7Q6K5_9COLE|nr:hypothetical protein RN001_005309 [Aquatica leii]
MEFRPQDISQLVLGYLKDSKCKKAFLEFLNTSVYLREHAANYRRGRYFITRVLGLSLVDYLNEYALIYTIVQERLEASEFFKENQCRSPLVNQLLYLLDKLEVESRTSTPINHGTIINGNCFEEDVINNSNNLDDAENVTGHVSFDKISNKVNSTPRNRSLNTSAREFSSLNNSKSKTLTPTADKSTTTEDETDGKEKSHEKCEEIFTNTFLENVELIEKLADNINKEVGSKSNAELDSTAIETIVQRTEADPIFVQLLNELIETPNEKDKTMLVDVPDLSKSSLSDRSKEVVSSKKCSTPSNETNIKRRLRSSKPSDQLNANSIDEQNNDVVELICMHAASLSTEPISANVASKSSTLISTELVLSTEQNVNVAQSLYTTPGVQNTMLTNTGSLLMLQPSTSISASNILPQKTLTVDTSKPCYLIGNQPLLSVSVPPVPLKVPNIVTEQDILNMPTIFVCDTSQQLPNAQTMVVPGNVSAHTIGLPRYQTIAPKHTPEKVQSLSEFITLYKCNDVISSPRISSPNVSSPPKLIPIHSKQTPLNKNLLQIITENACASIEPETTDNESNLDNMSKKAVSVVVPLSSSLEFKSESPEVRVPEKKEKSSRNTPKGSSHIRQLDFSTPEKCIPLALTESSSKVKKNNSRCVRTTLFKSSNEEETTIKEKKNDESKKSLDKSSETSKPAWDANLREFHVSKSPTRSARKKPSKRKRLEDSLKQVLSAKKLKEDSNNTDENVCNKPTVKNEDIDNENMSNLSTGTSSTKKTKSTEKRLDKSASKKKANSETKTKKKSTEATSDGDSTTPKTNIANDEKTGTVKHENQVEKSFELVHRNMNTKVRKKCNIESAKKMVRNDEVVLTNVPKIKSLEVLSDNKNTLFLSPSKLNVNKRTLVEIENHAVLNQNLIKTTIDSDSKNDSITEEFVNSLPKINSLPLLQTPVKVDAMLIPKTPGINLSTTIETPFTKAVIDQLNGVDINSIPTPKFPITPNFALTPALAHSPFSNRGTDYSTSSSYYQPSDTEQNKSLEQLIQECQRLEKQDFFSNNRESSDKEPSLKNQKLDETEHSTTSLDTIVHVASINDNNETVEKSEIVNKPGEMIHNILAEKQRAFNESLSGKKNMHLVKMLSDAAENEDSDWVSSKDDSSTSYDDTSSSSCSCITSPVKEKASPYSLRPRKALMTNNSQDEKVTSKNGKLNSPESIVNEEKTLTTHKADVLQKMEAIRQRTIAKFKDNDSALKQKSGTSARSLTKLRKESFKISTELFPKVQKSITFEDKVDENQTATNSKNIENATDSIPNVSGRNAKKKSDNLTITEKSKGRNKKLSNIVESLSSSLASSKVKFTKGKPENKCTIENKAVSVSKQSNKEDVTTAVDEEDIVLHLSSDDENLEPFELVETELLECSASSTPLSVDVKEDIDVNNKNKAEESNDKNADKEAENLVKELKQWGIHLIPNKLAKNKATTDVKDIKDTKLEDSKQPHSTKLTNNEEKDNLRRTETRAVKGDVEEIKKIKSLQNEKSLVSNMGETKTATQTVKKISIRSKNNKIGVDLNKSKITVTEIQEGKNTRPLESVENKLLCDVKERQLVELVKSKSLCEVKDEQLVKTVVEERFEGNKRKPPESVKNKKLGEIREKRIIRSSERTSSIEEQSDSNKPKPSDIVKNKLSCELKEKQIERSSERKSSLDEQTDTNKHKSSEIVKKKLSCEVKEKQIVRSSERKISVEQCEGKKLKSPLTATEKIMDEVKEKQVIRSGVGKSLVEEQSESNKSKPSETANNKSPSEVKQKIVKCTERKSLAGEQCEENKTKPSASLQNKSSYEVKDKQIVRSNQRKSSVEEQSEGNKPQPPDTVNNKSSSEVKEKQMVISSEQNKSIEERKLCSSIEKEEHVVNIMDFEPEFNIKTYEAETISIKYDYNATPSRKLSDYDFNILTKTVSANVFIEQIGSEVEQFMSFSRFKILLDIPSKSLIKKVEKGRDNEEQSSVQTRKRKPLNILYNQLIKEPVDIQNQSPLENLYSYESSSREKFAVRRSILDSNAKSERMNRSKRLLSVDKSGCSKEEEAILEIDKNAETECLEITKTEDTQIPIFLKSGDNVDNDIESEKQDSVTDIENDLMNYALIGSERVENNEEGVNPSSDKRKRNPSDDISLENRGDKKKKTEQCQELLRNIDVDSFLKQLHGDM